VRKLLDGKETELSPQTALMLSYAPSSYRWNRADPFKTTSGMSTDEIAMLNEGGEVAYPVTSIIFADPPSAAESRPKEAPK